MADLEIEFTLAPPTPEQIPGFDVAASAAAPVQSVNGKTGNVVLTKTDLDLDQVDNTSDPNKPVSTAQAAADAVVLSSASDYTDQEVLTAVNALRDGVAPEGDTLQKLFSMIQLQAKQYSVADIPERDALVVETGDYVFVVDDGDGNWALYRALTDGVGADYIKISDPDLLNAVMTSAQIAASYESYPDRNAFTNALKSKLEGIASGATANRSDASTDTIISNSAAAALSSANAYTDAKAEIFTAATIAARDALNVTAGDFVHVTDDGDTYWALYRASTSGTNAAYTKLSDYFSVTLRKTEAEMNAMVSPLTGLRVYNTTRKEYMVYTPPFGWVGMDSVSTVLASATTPTVTTNIYYFSLAAGLAMRTTIAGLACKPSKKGKMISANFTRFIASTLGNRSYSLYVRVNDTTDYLVATQAATATETAFDNFALNTTGIPMDPATDTYVMKLVVSGGTIDSANVLFFGNTVIR